MHFAGERQKLLLQRLGIEPRAARFIEKGEGISHVSLCYGSVHHHRYHAFRGKW